MFTCNTILVFVSLQILPFSLSVEPLWFPDLSCHPSYQENKFVFEEGPDHHNRKGGKYYKELAAECNNYTKDDPCLRHCVLTKWGLNLEVEDPQLFDKNHFFKNILKNSNESKHLRDKIVESCAMHQPPYGLGELLHDNVSHWTCSNNSFVYDCVETILDCKHGLKMNETIPLKYFNLSCHPNFIKNWEVLKHGKYGLISKMETACRWYLENGKDRPLKEHCIVGCIFSMQILRRRLIHYKMAVDTNDRKGMELEVKRLAEFMPGFRYMPQKTQEDRGSSGVDVAKKILENCAKLFDESMRLETCPAENEYWETFSGCLMNIFKCKT